MRDPLARLRDLCALPMLVVPVLCAATLAWGADSPLAGFACASLILCIAGLSLLVAGGPVCPLPLVVAFAVLCALLMVPAPRSSPMHVEYATFLASAGVFICARIIGHSRRATARIWTICLFLAALFALWSVWDALTDARVPTQRLAASFLSANTAAAMLGMIAILASAEWMRVPVGNFFRRVRSQSGRSGDGGELSGVMGLAAFLFAVAGVFLTGSRAGAVLCVTALVALVTWNALSSGRTSRANVLALVVIAVVAIVCGGLVLDRFDSSHSAYQVRMAHFSAYWQAIEMRPFFGIGLGGFERAVAGIMTPDDAIFLHRQGAAHNICLQWFMQAGILGSLTMGVILAAILRDILRGVSRARSHRRILRAMICVCAFVLAHGMVDYALEIPGFMWWWVWGLGLAHGVATRPTRTTANRQGGMMR